MGPGNDPKVDSESWLWPGPPPGWGETFQLALPVYQGIEWALIRDLRLRDELSDLEAEELFFDLMFIVTQLRIEVDDFRREEMENTSKKS